MKKKILYSIAGHTGGHVACANAIVSAINELKEDSYEHKLIDLQARCTKFVNFVANSYAVMNEYFPWFYKWMYYSTNEPKKFRRMFEFYYLLYRKAIVKILKEERPDIILSLYALPTSFLVRIVKEMGLDTPVITIVLDPVSVHASWVDPESTRIVVVTEKAREACIKFGMLPEKIKVIGFPINPRFLKECGNRIDLRREFDLDPNLFTVLIMGGGIGIGGIYNIIQALNSTDLNIQIIVVAGLNKRLELKLLRTKFRFPAKIFGFTDRIPEIMCASDCIITKAGPGAIFEAISRELPLIITGNIPGQEEGNVDYVQKNGIGIIVREPNKIVETVRRMQTVGTEEFKSNMRQIRNPAAVYEIAKLIVSYLE